MTVYILLQPKATNYLIKNKAMTNLLIFCAIFTVIDIVIIVAVIEAITRKKNNANNLTNKNFIKPIQKKILNNKK